MRAGGADPFDRRARVRPQDGVDADQGPVEVDRERSDAPREGRREL
jgi:hypothetical protein